MDRKQALIAWTQKSLADPECYLKPASSDASFRSYWRVFSQSNTYIVMDAPVEHENSSTFVDVSRKLTAAGLQVPIVYSKNLDDGFLLLSDLGTVQYLDILTEDNCQTLYTDAISALHTIQQKASQKNLPLYDQQLLNDELNLFSDWFIDKHLGFSLSERQSKVINNCHMILIDNAQQQAQTFVHRDYHSRNLMKTASHNPGILDFQDAVIGPVTYDLVSLLKDCYIAWPSTLVNQFSDQFRINYNGLNNTEINAETWQRWFDLMGIQRHLKAIGIFCRLNYRDHKPNYLKDINRTLCYVKTCCNKYPELNEFLELLHEMSPSMANICEH
ncbi:MAG TPA: aminoglycoside phosphotransferase [Oceanospirillales bacterium]|nr:aminoglycoside phosphotransferase [Oceanospirillales bacterium]